MIKKLVKIINNLFKEKGSRETVIYLEVVYTHKITFSNIYTTEIKAVTSKLNFHKEKSNALKDKNMNSTIIFDEKISLMSNQKTSFHFRSAKFSAKFQSYSIRYFKCIISKTIVFYFSGIQCSADIQRTVAG